MREPRDSFAAGLRKVHPHHWLWEPLEQEAGFVLRPMFGARAVYLDGRMMCAFTAKEEPWRGLLICTERSHQAALQADFPVLNPHPILPKWLYLPEAADSFERTARLLIELIRRRDPRIGIIPPAKKRRGRGKEPKRAMRPGLIRRSGPERVSARARKAKTSRRAG